MVLSIAITALCQCNLPYREAFPNEWLSFWKKTMPTDQFPGTLQISMRDSVMNCICRGLDLGVGTLSNHCLGILMGRNVVDFKNPFQTSRYISLVSVHSRTASRVAQKDDWIMKQDGANPELLQQHLWQAIVSSASIWTHVIMGECLSCYPFCYIITTWQGSTVSHEYKSCSKIHKHNQVLLESNGKAKPSPATLDFLGVSEMKPKVRQKKV